MPIYVFRCDHCGRKFERLQKMSDPDPEACPHCGTLHAIRKQVTAPAFRLAGKGWYETDFKSSSEHKYNLAGDAGKPADSSAKPAKPAREAAAPPAVEKTAKAVGD